MTEKGWSLGTVELLHRLGCNKQNNAETLAVLSRKVVSLVLLMYFTNASISLITSAK